MAETLRVTLVMSTIGRKEKQKRIAAALGLRRLGQSVLHPNSAVVRGMVAHISHLVAVEQVSESDED